MIDVKLINIKKIFRFIRDFKGDPVYNIKILVEDKDYHIDGGGIFFKTQLLAGAHPDEYVILEEKISNALRYLGITDILVKYDTAEGYIYVNEICKKLYNDKLESRLKEKNYNFGLAAVHNFLWHYYSYYRLNQQWMQ